MTKRRYPMTPYPDGWFRVAYSNELEPGKSLPLEILGQELVLFRTESGEAALLDAYCPHLGAHLGHGGVVKGERLECPFHAWQLDTKGDVAHIPYASKVPPRAKTRCHELREHSGMIFMWHHHKGEAPSFEVPQIAEYYDEKYTEYRDFRLKLRTHIQETAENGVDTAHLHVVHEVIDPVASAEVLGTQLNVHVDMKANMMGGAGVIPGTIDMEYYGLGVTAARVNVGPVKYIFLTTVTPIDDEYLDARFIVSMKKKGGPEVTELILKRILEDEEQQVRRDIPIWENKAFPHPPLLCDGDGPVGMFRKWAKQFYGPWNEPTEERDGKSPAHAAE
jgi:nitrite reductase/ring-hydroxylating ferredoxin subunit